ncbi:MAG: PIG-L family deacetylase [Cytophagales bacterium]|nr:PIG-L family deacetylase [Cytophagales bacterium]
MLESLKNKKILVIAAHPDDEVLGLGATMHRLIHNSNCKIDLVILGEGITSRAEQRDRKKWKKELETHRSNINRAASIIGYDSVKTYDFPDNRFDAVDLLDIVKVVEKEKNKFQPEVIFTHHGGDLNIDHQRTFEAVITATRPMEGENVKTIIAFETPSSTEWQASNHPTPFLPNMFFEVSIEDIEAKIKGMECYEYETRKYPHPRSSEALEIQAKRWGVAIGKDYAEAFMLIRDIL